MRPYSEYILGDMLLSYGLDEQNCVSMSLIPASMKAQVKEKEYHPEPLVQIHARGDQLRTYDGDRAVLCRDEVHQPARGREYGHHGHR